MAEYVKLTDADLVRAAGQMIKDAGDTLESQTSDARARIESIEANQPWGSDQYGQTFLQTTYDADWNGTPANEVLKTLLDSVDALPTVGENITSAVTSLQLADLNNQSIISGSTVDRYLSPNDHS
jgi:hypothetical protein